LTLRRVLRSSDDRLDTAIVFALRIERATLVQWDITHGQMVVVRWSRGRGLTEITRS
jgi:hypothetical protein